MAMGQPEDEVRARGRKLHAWAAVHRNGLQHLPHTHPGHMISGVYVNSATREL